MGQLQTIAFCYEELHRDELTPEEYADLDAAMKARDNAYAPYSRFLCGTHIRMQDGAAAVGWNVENSIFHVLHAEANALGRVNPASRASGLRRLTTVGGYEKSDSETIVSPCGACRQNLLEIVRPQDNPVVIMAGVRGRVLRAKLRDLLPLAFDPTVLTSTK